MSVAFTRSGVFTRSSRNSRGYEILWRKNFRRLSCRGVVRSSAFISAGSAGIQGQSWSCTSWSPTCVFFRAPASTTQMTLQRAFLPSYCTPMTSPTFKSGSIPYTQAPVALIFWAIAFWKKGWLLLPIPHTLTFKSRVARGADPWAGINALLHRRKHVNDTYLTICGFLDTLPEYLGYFESFVPEIRVSPSIVRLVPDRK